MKLYHLFASTVKKKVDERAAIDRCEKMIGTCALTPAIKLGAPSFASRQLA